ncbi:hypothetical protein M8494_09260 [Serratia ureilytica]
MAALLLFGQSVRCRAGVERLATPYACAPDGGWFSCLYLSLTLNPPAA